jgi:hypothetical protein
MIDVSKMKLGKRPAVHDKRTLLLSDYVTNALKPPPRVDWSMKLTHIGEMLNDQLGICTIAAAGHMIQTWTAANGSQIILPDNAILKGYEEACGYNPADPSTDNGGVEVTVLNYLRKTGLGGHKIYAYVAQEPGNRTHIELAVDLLGGCYLGLELPRSIQGQRVWSVPPGGPVGDGAPGSLGGHAVPAVAYGPAGITVITWGQLLTMTWKFFSVYCSESYGVLSPDWANGTKLAPSGFDLAALQADLAAITG